VRRKEYPVTELAILVTGGCGFIGSTLAARLVQRGHDVTVLDDLSTGHLQNIEGLDVHLVKPPYRDLARVVPQLDAIYHLGIPSSTMMYRRDPHLVGKAVNDAIDVFEAARTHGCKVVYASTSSLYNGNPVPYHEAMPILVTDYYTECRRAIERLARLYDTLYGVAAVGLRFFSVYGPKERHKGRYANVVSQFLWAMQRGEAPVIYGDGSQTRDFIYVDDIVDALMRALERDGGSDVFNVGTGTAHSYNQVVDRLNQVLGTAIEPRYQPNPIANYVQHTLADTRKAEHDLGFRASTAFDAGVRAILDPSA
jgi:UDP-glucose 4-epimerase